MQYFVGAFNDDRFDAILQMANARGYSTDQYYADMPTILSIMLVSQATNMWQVVHLRLSEHEMDPANDAAAATAVGRMVCYAEFWQRTALLSDHARVLTKAVETSVDGITGVGSCT